MPTPNGQAVRHPDDPGPSDPDAPKTPVLADLLLDRTALRALPDPEPLIDDVLDRGTTALLYGRWGTYKSFIALDWAASVATGRKWMGRNTTQLRTLYVAAEGAFGLKSRVDAWEVGWQVDVADGTFEVLPRPVNLTHPVDVANLRALVEWNGYGFVVIDTLARCMVGGDENSAKDCGLVVDALTRLRESTPAGRGAILGVHHTGKDAKTLRGSSAFEAGVDTVYSAAIDGKVVTLDREKRKDGPKQDRHDVVLDLMPGTDSGVISLYRSGADKPARAGKLLTIFQRHFGNTGATKAELRLVAEMPPVTFHRALSDLLETGEIENTGTDKRPFYKGSR